MTSKILRINNRKGSAFVIVIGVLAIIIFAATTFMTSTVEEGRQTNMSIRGLHASSLAEAALERAMRVLTEKINKVDPATAQPEDLAITIRLPAKEGSSTFGQSENFGTDKELILSDAMKKEMTLTKDDLQKDGEKELDELVDYMTDKSAKSYEVTVKAKVSQAFRNSPGKDYPDYKIPGVDIGWNTRYDVANFLNGEGYSAFEIALPSGLSWLDFSIPIKIGSIELIDINVTNIIGTILEKALPPITIGSKEYKINEFTEFNTLADLLLNQLIAKGAKKIYPIEVKLDKIKMPKSISELWPSGVGVSEADGQYLEKYGQISMECEAKITYKDNYTSARRVTAIKDFKVADCEPPAPMYSFFVNNTQNDRVAFNNYGGQFFVNNFDYTGVLSKVKDMITGTSGLSDDELESREFPGLIRVNYIDQSANQTAPIMCNIGLLGDWGSTDIEGDDSGFLSRLFNGIEALVLLCPDSSMAVVNSSYNINSTVMVKNPSTNEKVPLKLTGTYEKGKAGSTPLVGGIANYSAQVAKERKTEMAGSKDWLKSITGGLGNGANLVPNVGGMSTNVISLAVTLALKPLVGAVAGDYSSAISVKDCFESWDMPAMGTSNSLYPIPTTGTGANKSHLFGYGGLHPTLTKEIEGDVMKVYRQWKMCIVGLNPTDRLPLLPFPPVFLPPPPLVVPIWQAAQVVEKYDFNVGNLKAHDDVGEIDCDAHAYDPALLENMAPNLYTNEQYAKKATYYYENADAFIEDLPNRTTELDGKTVFVLNGITYISGTLGDASNPFTVDGDTLYVVGKGMIVCSGNIYLGCNVVALDRSADEPTVFTLMCRKGALLVMKGGLKLRFEGSLYTERGMYVHNKSSLHIVGNWVTNAFNKPSMGGTVVVDYVSSRVRTSLGSLHPTRGKYDPRRYHVSFSPAWAAWRAH